MVGFYDIRETNKLVYRSDIKDDKFNISEIFSNDKVIKAAY